MTAFATSDDVAALLQRALTDDEITAATLALDMVSSEIEEAIGRSYTGGTNNINVPGNWDQWIELPSTPTSIESVSINGTVLSSSSGWFWRAGRLLRRGPNPAEEMMFAADYDGPILQGAQPYIGSFHWGGPGSTVTIGFTAPSTAVPAFLKGYAINAVIGILTNPTQIESEALGAYQVRYVAKGERSLGILSPSETAMLRRRFRRPAGTIIPTVR